MPVFVEFEPNPKICESQLRSAAWLAGASKRIAEANAAVVVGSANCFFMVIRPKCGG